MAFNIKTGGVVGISFNLKLVFYENIFDDTWNWFNSMSPFNQLLFWQGYAPARPATVNVWQANLVDMGHSGPR